MLKQIKAVIVGYGNRGQVYADYSLDRPEELSVVAVVDPNEFKLEEAKKRYSLSSDRLFGSFEEFLKSKIECDIVINATMDEMHYETAMQILENGYDMLIEKPIVPNKKELFDIKKAAEKKNLRVFVCHVLRYTPFYKTIKKLIADGEIGEIISMEMNEHVCRQHYLASYDRGKWNSEEKCGSGFLLAKCCHDFDIMCWLNNATAPEKVSSMGSRSEFVRERMPKDASEFCYECKYKDVCRYSALREYIDLNVMPFLVWDKLNKPLDEITKEEKIEFLKHDNYGRCAYIAGGDIVDRQNAIIAFKNGSQCSFTLVAGATKPDRYIHIVGQWGEIEGKIEEGLVTLRKYDPSPSKFYGVEEVIDVNKRVVNNARFGGHNGGDFAIMNDLIRYLNGERTSLSITTLDDSVNGHLCVFAAEESRKEEKVVRL